MTILRFFPALLFVISCRSTPEVGKTPDPTVRLHTGASGELGVSTEYGVVFLGRGAGSGAVEFTAWFDDGPSFETGVIEPLGGGLFTTQAEIALPIVPITWSEPQAGAKVFVRGRRGSAPFVFEAEIAHDPSVEGLLLRPSSDLRGLSDGEAGAGVYVEGEHGPLLLGLVSGKLTLGTAEGEREYFAVAGPRDLWRLSVHRRDLDRPRRRALREDVLP